MLAEFIATAATGASLAMDAFSVSICIGLCHDRISAKNVLTVGGAFGFFQFFMPLLGGVIAGGLSGFFSTWTPWIAAALIVWVAVNMIREAASGGEDDCSSMTISFATSLDALAVGFSIESTGGSAMSLAVLAGIITFALSAAGTIAGKKVGSHFGRKAEYVGGGVLLVIAARIILQAL